MLKQLHQSFLVFSTEDGVYQRRVTELYIKQANLGDLKRCVIQIDRVACLEGIIGFPGGNSGLFFIRFSFLKLFQIVISLPFGGEFFGYTIFVRIVVMRLIIPYGIQRA